MKPQTLLQSMRCAAAGLWACLRRERNVRLMLAAGVHALALGYWMALPPAELALLLLTVAAVLAAEGLNTALEAAVDLCTPERRPLAKLAKDAAAGAVLLLSLASLGVAWLLFGPPERLWAALAAWLASPGRCVALALSLVLWLMFAFALPPKRPLE